MAEFGRYLYAISRRLDPAALEGVGALDGRPLEVIEHRGLSAVVSDVDLAEFGEEGLTRNLEKLDWLETVARGHDAVVQALAARWPTAPLRLATICLDDDGVRSRLDEWYTALDQALDRIEGRMEWSVKAFAPARPAASTSASSAAVGGAEYLRRKKAQTEARYADDEAAAGSAEQAHAALSRVCVASRRLAAQDPRLTGHEGTMLLNGAYLVPVGDESAFTEVVRTLQQSHPQISLECQGPWPPYSFATLEQA